MDTVINDIKIPYHVGIILDGNGRWAQKRNLPRSQGHLKGLENLKNLLPYIYKRGVKIISIYAFSIENFKRSKEEVDFLMNIFVEKLPKELKTLMDNDIKIVFSSDISVLPSNVVKVIEDITYKTKDNKSGVLNICLGYSSRQEILEATKKISNDILNNKINISDINEELFNKYLYNELDDIDLLIRTSGELRISNFMLWQISYAELYFPKVFFPDFDSSEFDLALIEYTKRDRRFGGINEKKTN